MNNLVQKRINGGGGIFGRLRPNEVRKVESRANDFAKRVRILVSIFTQASGFFSPASAKRILLAGYLEDMVKLRTVATDGLSKTYKDYFTAMLPSDLGAQAMDINSPESFLKWAKALPRTMDEFGNAQVYFRRFTVHKQNGKWPKFGGALILGPHNVNAMRRKYPVNKGPMINNLRSKGMLNRGVISPFRL